MVGNNSEPDVGRFTTSYDRASGAATLTIRGTRVTDEMSYKCVASNKHGSARSSCALFVQSSGKKKPLAESTSSISGFFSRPLDTVCEESECSASSSGAESPTESSCGDSFCSMLVRPVETLRVRVGETIKLACEVAGRPEPLSVAWFKDDKALGDNHRMDIYEDRGTRCLEICACERADAGEYRVVARNLRAQQVQASTLVQVVDTGDDLDIGEQASTTTTFTISAPVRVEAERAPAFVLKPTNLVAHEGQRVVVEARISGLPLPDIVWYRHGKAIPREQFDVRQASGVEHECCTSLVIQSCSILDTDEYACSACNTLGSVYASLTLNVEGIYTKCLGLLKTVLQSHPKHVLQKDFWY